MIKIKRRLYKHLWLTRLVFFALIFSLFIGLVWFFVPPLVRGSLFIGSALNPAITHLDQFRGRTNILLLGVAGADHDGPDLTDSLILLSINPQTNDTVLLSLPRDIWVESLSAKLNAAYHFGEQAKAGGGLTLAKASVSEILNQPVHYAVLINFSGFEKAIDLIGGVTVNVPRGFTDNQYPVPGRENSLPESSRYETVIFSSGVQTMDGPTALKYVRSRHAEGEEGTDFARSQRQQRVILAFKDKLLTSKILLNFKTLANLRRIFSQSVVTDIESSTYADFVKLLLRVNRETIRTGIIDQGSFSEDIPPLLYNPPVSVYGQWTLLPIDNDWTKIYRYVEELFYQNQ